MKTRRKISPRRTGPFSSQKLGEDQKKKKEKGVRPDSAIWVLKLSAQVTKWGGLKPQFCILFHANYTVLPTERDPP